MRRNLVAGNWKMHGRSSSAARLAARVRDGLPSDCEAEVVLCPPFVHLLLAAARLEGARVGLGAQNVCEREDGAHTGEVSAEMLVDIGCTYVIVGHSERRSLHGETDQVVARKYLRACHAGLTPILCLGESLNEREAGRTRRVVERQLTAVAEHCGEEALRGGVIAYEPVWAIGSGRSATPEQAQDVHAFIRSRLGARWGELASGVRIVYGGSVKAGNAKRLFSMPDVDGGLIGGASLDADEFIRICALAG